MRPFEYLYGLVALRHWSAQVRLGQVRRDLVTFKLDSIVLPSIPIPLPYKIKIYLVFESCFWKAIFWRTWKNIYKWFYFIQSYRKREKTYTMISNPKANRNVIRPKYCLHQQESIYLWLRPRNKVWRTTESISPSTGHTETNPMDSNDGHKIRIVDRGWMWGVTVPYFASRLCNVSFALSITPCSLVRPCELSVSVALPPKKYIKNIKL